MKLIRLMKDLTSSFEKHEISEEEVKKELLKHFGIDENSRNTSTEQNKVKIVNPPLPQLTFEPPHVNRPLLKVERSGEQGIISNRSLGSMLRSGSRG